MKKQELSKEEHGFEHDDIHDEFLKRSKNKDPMGNARVEFLKEGNRVGKFYWDEIRYIYDHLEKPFVEIKTQNNLKLIIYQDKFDIIPEEQKEDTCYLNALIPNFDTVEFYDEFEWIIKLVDLIQA